MRGQCVTQGSAPARGFFLFHFSCRRQDGRFLVWDFEPIVFTSRLSPELKSQAFVRRRPPPLLSAGRLLYVMQDAQVLHQ